MDLIGEILGPHWDPKAVWNILTTNSRTKNEKGTELLWTNIISITAFHVIALCALVGYWGEFRLYTIFWGILIGALGGFGVTGGAHRLWSHRAFKANYPLQVLLLICYTIAGQNTVFDWVRDHRVHHKFSETDADPHNAKRGFFFSHVGWLMCRKLPEVIQQGRKIDMSDITGDPLLEFHRRHFIPLKICFCFVLPTIVPPLCWNESWKLSILSMVFVRYIFGLNFTWLVNSAAHIWGNKPYDRRIGPVENKTVAFLAMGEGWHNYHHVFPWDYRAAELGSYSLNLTTLFLDFFYFIGWAYDLKVPSQNLVNKISAKYGDGTRTPEPTSEFESASSS